MTDPLRHRTAQEVFDDHLSLAAQHRFDEDIERNAWIVAQTCAEVPFRGSQLKRLER